MTKHVETGWDIYDEDPSYVDDAPATKADAHAPTLPPSFDLVVEDVPLPDPPPGMPRRLLKLPRDVLCVDAITGCGDTSGRAQPQQPQLLSTIVQRSFVLRGMILIGSSEGGEILVDSIRVGVRLVKPDGVSAVPVSLLRAPFAVPPMLVTPGVTLSLTLYVPRGVWKFAAGFYGTLPDDDATYADIV